MEGGGANNGSFLRAGLVDELRSVICPVVDGDNGAPCVFDSMEREAGEPAPAASMTLKSCRRLEKGAVWLRYTLTSD